MFEMKYDAQGNPIRNPELEKQAKEPMPEPEPEESSEPTSETTQALESLDTVEEAPESSSDNDNQPEYEEKPPERYRNENDRNIRALREKARRADELERERDEVVKAYLKLQSEGSKKSDTPDEDFVIGPDDLVEGKHIARIERKYQQKLEELERKYSEAEKVSKETAIETKIKNQYPDFDKVVSPENIEYLRENEPELAYALNSSSDLYTKAVSAYKIIKKMGIYKEDTYQKERAIAQKNAAKPKSLNSIAPQQGESPLSNANAFADGLTPDLKNKLWAEMNDIRKRNG